MATGREAPILVGIDAGINITFLSSRFGRKLGALPLLFVIGLSASMT